MPAHKRKPYYNGATTMQELLTAVCDYYGDPVDDRNSEDPDHGSLHDVADSPYGASSSQSVSNTSDFDVISRISSNPITFLSSLFGLLSLSILPCPP